MTLSEELQLVLLLAIVAVPLALKLSLWRLEQRIEADEQRTRFVHWASTHERKAAGVVVCGCLRCEQMRRDLGLPETWRWRKWTIPSKYT